MANPNLTNIAYIETKSISYVLDEISQTIVRNPAASNYLIKIVDITASNLNELEGVIEESVTLGIVRSGVIRYLAYTVGVTQDNTITLVSDITAIFLEEGDSLIAFAGTVDTVALNVNFQILSENAFTYSNLISRLVSSKYDVANNGDSFTIKFKASGHPVGSSYAYSISGVTSAQINGASLTGTISPNGTILYQTSGSTVTNFVFSIPSLSISVTVNLSAANFYFTSFTFTNANVIGQNGPTLAQCLSAYDTVNYPWLTNTNNFNVTVQGIQEFTVPQTANYRITARGGDGGIFSGTYAFAGYAGAGALVSGTFSLTKDTKLYIVVGQRPSSATQQTANFGSAGGGGTFVYTGSTPTSGIGQDANLYLVAGGGGGTGHGSSNTTGGNGKGGSATTNSRESTSGENFGINARIGNGSTGNQGIGFGGNGGGNSVYGGSGGGTGWKGNGQDYQFGTSFRGFGGQRFQGGGNSNDGPDLYGGWGGGGGSDGNGNAGGGGGGYTGGGAGNGYGGSGFTAWGGGGGGGSFIRSGAVEPSSSNGADGINVTDAANGFVQILKI